MTDNEKRAHDIAVVVTKINLENDLQVSKSTGSDKINLLRFSELTERFILHYNIVYRQLLTILNDVEHEND